MSRACERCGTEVPDEWRYGWCEECCENGTCHHGNRPEDCNDCMIESDLAYDAHRMTAIPTNRPQDGRVCNCEDAPCCNHYES